MFDVSKRVGWFGFWFNHFEIRVGFDIQLSLRIKNQNSPSLEWWTGGIIGFRLFILPILPSSPILIIRVVWSDNLETILTNKDPVLVFLDTNSKKCVLLKGTLMTWLHLSNLNPNSASEFSLLKNEVWENSGVSPSHYRFSLRSFLRSWSCFNISCSNSYWYSVGRPSFSPCPLIFPS